MNGTSMDAKQQRRDTVAGTKRQLQDELRKIQEQKAAIERQLEALKQRGVAIPAAPPAGAPPAARPGSASHHVSPTAAAALAVAGKRAAPLALGAAAGLDHPNKRQRILDQRKHRVKDIFKQCKSIIATLRKNSNSNPFLVPVDPVKTGAVDYYKIISRPMDIGTVSKKLDKDQYASPMDFAADVRQIWKNCATYNAPGQQVAIMGQKMEAAWEQKWQTSGIEQKWANEMALQQQEDAELDEKLTGTPAEQAQQLDARLQHNLASKARKQPAAAAGPPGQRQMTFEEKRRLSVVLGQLSGEQLGGILDIIAASQPGLDPDSEEEVELDMDTLEDAVLWKLKAYVDGLAQGGGKQARTASGPARSGPPDGGAGGQHEQQSRPPPDADMAEEGGASDEGEGEGGASKMDSTYEGTHRTGVQHIQQPIDESRTNDKQKPVFVTNKPAAPVAAGQLNTAAWASVAAKQEPAAAAAAPAAAAAAAAAGPAPGDDEVWADFQGIAAKQAAKKKEEDEARRRQQEEEERQRAALEAEERRQEQEKLLAKEQEKAQLVQKLDHVEATVAPAIPDNPAMLNAGLLNPAGGMEELGLVRKHDDDEDEDEW